MKHMILKSAIFLSRVKEAKFQIVVFFICYFICDAIYDTREAQSKNR